MSVSSDILYHSIHSWGQPQSSNAFVKRNGRSITQIEQWLAIWANTIFTFAILIVEGTEGFATGNEKARANHLRRHVVRIFLKPSNATGNKQWTLGDTISVCRAQCLSPESPFYLRDTKVDFIVDLRFQDEDRNELGGSLYGNLGDKLKTQLDGNSNIVFRHLQYDVGMIKRCFDEQQNPSVTRFSRGPPGLILQMENGERGIYLNGRFVPDDRTKTPYPVMIQFRKN